MRVDQTSRRSLRPICLLVAILLGALAVPARAQVAAPQPGEPAADDPSAQNSGELADEQFEAAMSAPGPPPDAAPPEPVDQRMNLLRMASPQVGGIFLYPIYAFSFVVVLFGIERMLGLRRRRVVPRKLVNGFRELLAGQGGFDPRKAYRLCQRYPSAAATVLRAGLLKIGRPSADLEHAITQAGEREAARLYANIRPLNLSATVAPLLGLIGTVQGMIVAFYTTAYLPDGANKAQALAEGVYIALVTTFAGLCVAIPAVCLAHYFEGKIQRLFRQIDELVSEALPVLERYEGKLRASRGSSAIVEGGDGSSRGEGPKQPATTSET